MIWGCISAKGRGGLWFLPKNATINSSVYLGIVEEKVPDWMAMRNCELFQHDGAPAHSSKVVRNWLHQNGIEVLEKWPGSSPDLNPIENCWAVLKKKVVIRQPTSHADLVEVIKDVWCVEITDDYCRNLIDSMPRRLAAVLKAKGGPIG